MKIQITKTETIVNDKSEGAKYKVTVLVSHNNSPDNLYYLTLSDLTALRDHLIKYLEGDKNK
jgi:hypothetical protein